MLLARLVAEQRGQLFLWTPVCLGVGVAIFFALPVEPVLAEYLAVALVAATCLGLSARLGETAAPLMLGLALVLTGGLMSGLRAHLVAGPVLEQRYYGPIEGTIRTIDRSASDKPRIMLEEVVILGVAPARTPDRVRISLHGDQSHLAPQIGQRIAVTGHLYPPPGAVEPGGFDFRRHAWFLQLGAVGYARTPALAVAEPKPGDPAAWLGRLRRSLSAGVQGHLDGPTGAFAAAVMTGDRSALDEPTLEAMRAANLAHLIAISGLHIGLVSGVVFTAARLALALWPAVALRLPARKLAAVAALAAAAGYLALSGAPVSAQRAFVMAAVFLTAVLLDRRALTLRSVALAALIVLIWQPEAMLGPGFQMSFAATAALVWAFARLREFEGRFGRPPSWARGPLALVISSAVAGLATAPIAAAHFNQAAVYGLAANLMAVPVMGGVVAPAGVAAGLLAPVGLEGPALTVMGWGIDWILAVATQISALEGAVRYLPSPPPWAFSLVVVGGLAGLLLRGRAMVLALVPLALALALWTQGRRPEVLIADSGALVGVMTDEGRALNRRYSQGFVAEVWLENDGRGRDRDQAYARMQGFKTAHGHAAALGPVSLAALARPSVQELVRTCRDHDIVVADRRGAPVGGCLLLDPARLSRTGTLALSRGRDGAWAVASVRGASGARLWSDRRTRRAFEDAHGERLARTDRPGPPPTKDEAELLERLNPAEVAAANLVQVEPN